MKYTPDSWFGVPQVNCVDGGVIQPIEDDEVVRRFHEDFKLTRPLDGGLADRTGTSIVVPWCDESLSSDTLAEAVVQSNFLPIISGDLVVAIGSAETSDDLVLDHETIEPAVESMEGDEKPALLASVRLAKWARQNGESSRVTAIHQPAARQSVKWEQYSLTDAERERLRARFEAGQPIAIRVPVPLRKKDRSERTSHMDVFLQRTQDGSTVRPVFVRGSVVIPDHQIRKVPNAVAIIRSSRDELGNLLRAAEDPGHKEWSTETENFRDMKDTFVYAKSYLTLARNAASRVYRLLQDDEADEDFDLLGDVFSLPKTPDDDGIKPEGKGRRRRRHKKPKIKIDRVPQMVAVTRVSKGFTLGRASADCPTPARIRIRAAYDVRKGDAFKHWDSADFSFDKAPMTVDAKDGLELERCEGNRIDLRVLKPEYSLSVLGFDTARGVLILNVRPEGRFNDTTD